MATLGDLMNKNKVLIDQPSAGVTYIGIAKYESYKTVSDTASEIWQIRKIEEDQGVTNMSYPNGDSEYKFSWDNRATYSYL